MPIGDCRLPIKKVARQLPPLSIGNQQSKIGNAGGSIDHTRKLSHG